MQLKHIALIIVIATAFAACQTQKITTENLQLPAIPQPDTTLIPAFSGELLYLFGREYEAIHDSLSAKFNTPEAALVRAQQISMSDYIEARLTTFFPGIAYKGMVQKWEAIAEQILTQQQAEAIIYNNQELGFQQTQRGVPPISKTDEEEALFLQLTEEEDSVFRQLNTLATSTRQATPDQLPNAKYRLLHPENKSFAPEIHDSFEEENILVSLLLAGGPYAFYRIMLAKKRAETKAKEYYGSDASAGKLGDAFKHTFVNVMLTSYLSEDIAKFVMNDVWEQWHVNAPCDRYMDLRNNYIGRHARYMELHGTSDDWHNWAENVYQFIQDTLKNATYQTWTHETPLFQIHYDIRNSPTNKFIYWNQEKTTVDE